MKNSILIALFVLFTISLFGQEKRIVYRSTNYTLQNGDYVVDNNIDKYVGTWEWKNGNDSFTIILKKKVKVKIVLNPNFIYYFDMAVGWYKYVKNGVVIENSLDKQNAVITDIKSVVENATINGFTQYSYLGLLVEITDKNFLADVRLETIPDKPDELQWTIYGKNTTLKAKQQNYTIPVNMVLKKVKTANGGIVGGGFGSIIVQ